MCYLEWTPLSFWNKKNMEIKKTTYNPDGEGGLIITETQDVTDIVEKNKKEYNLYDERARWSDELLGNKIASIPLAVIDDLNKKKILQGFRVMDEKKFKAWLNDGDNRFFRTRTGQV